MLVFRDGGLPPSLRGLIWRGSAVATVEARTKKLRAKNFDGIVGHQIAQISYWRLMINAALMLLDMTMFILASAVVLTWKNELVFHSARFGFSMPFAVYCLLAACIWVLCLRSMGVYHRHVMGDGYQLNVLMFKAIVECLIALCAFHFLLNMFMTLRSLVLIMLLTYALTVIERAIARRFIVRGRVKGQYSYSTVVIGSPEGISHAMRFLARKQQLNYKPIAVCLIRLNEQNGTVEPDDNLETLKKEVFDKYGIELPVLRYGDDLVNQIIASHAQTVMVTDVLHRFSDNFNTFALNMEAANLEIALVTSAVEIGGHETQIRNIQGTTVMTIRLSQYSPLAQFSKRVFDIVVSSIAIVMLSPVMLIVALLIKKEDGGPVFYTQERIGLRGKPFKIHKFRSMYVNADEKLAEVAAANGQEMGARVKIKKDPRITKIGHFIRKTSLDEIPQFFDSFVGTMSVVGPRPQRQFEVDEYNQVYATRLLVKPGITGPWQVSGRNDLSEEESQQLDVTYVQNWSIMGDIVYILRTVGIMINPKGAY
ncbi:sugar transferase [Bifidobacterium pseudocatenulatum]